MPGMQPIDRDVLTGFQHGDEKALEQLFRARFEPLTQQASAALGDEAAAPKVVEGAFVRIWEERGRIDSPEALEAFLFDAVKSGAARERSRRAAAHRMGGHDNHHAATTHSSAAAVTLDDAWAHVSTALHTPANVHSPQVQDALHEQLRHDAAVHVASLAKRPPWQLPTAIAVVLAITIFGAMRWMDRASADTAVTSALASPDGRNVSTLVAQFGSTTLLDGSKVALAADTKIRIPPNFGGAFRAIRVDGAASIDAAAAGERPLVVRVGDASVDAGNASLDVRAYAGEPAMVRVRSGQANVKALSSGAAQAVAAGQAFVVANGTITPATPEQVAEAFAWADKRFVVANKPLNAVLPQLVRFYGLEMKTPDQSILTRPVTLQASLESSRELIAALEKSANVQFGYEGKTMVLTPKK